MCRENITLNQIRERKCDQEPLPEKVFWDVVFFYLFIKISFYTGLQKDGQKKKKNLMYILI